MRVVLTAILLMATSTWAAGPVPVGEPLPPDFASDKVALVGGSALQIGSKILFSATGGREGSRLILTDGTPEGTEVAASFGTTSFTVFAPMGGNDQLGFMRRINNPDPHRLWVSDGTMAGTIQLPFSSVSIQAPDQPMPMIGGNLLFDAIDPVAPLVHLPFQTDGTAQGTGPATFIRDKGVTSTNLAAGAMLGNSYYFPAVHPDSGSEVWCTDGTALGTRMVAEIEPAAQSTTINKVFRCGDHLYARTSINHYYLIDPVEGTATGVRFGALPTGDLFNGILEKVLDDRFFALKFPQRYTVQAGTTAAIARPSGMNSFGAPDDLIAGRYLFARPVSGWVTEDLESGELTTILTPIIATPSTTRVGQRVVLSAQVNASGERRLYSTDGLNVQQIVMDGSEQFYGSTFAVFGDRAFYIGSTEASIGASLWLVDPVAGVGTEVADLATRPINLLRASAMPIPTTDHILWRTGVAGEESAQIFATNGEVGVPELLTEGLLGDAVAQAGVALIATRSSAGITPVRTGIIRTDGTQTGTQLRDAEGTSIPRIAPHGDSFIYSFPSGGQAVQIYQGDGTSTGEQQLASFTRAVALCGDTSGRTWIQTVDAFTSQQGIVAGFPPVYTPVTANVDWASAKSLRSVAALPEGTLLGYELFGLVLLPNGPDSSARLVNIDGVRISPTNLLFTQNAPLPVLGNTAYYATFTTPPNRVLSSLNLSTGLRGPEINVTGSANNAGMTSPMQTGNHLYWVAYTTGNVWKLFESDGTLPGTRTVATWHNAPDPTATDQIAAAGGRGVFVVIDMQATGAELYFMRPGLDAPILVADLNPGAVGSQPGNLSIHGDTLYFSAELADGSLQFYRMSISRYIASAAPDGGPTVTGVEIY